MEAATLICGRSLIAAPWLWRRSLGHILTTRHAPPRFTSTMINQSFLGRPVRSGNNLTSQRRSVEQKPTEERRCPPSPPTPSPFPAWPPVPTGTDWRGVGKVVTAHRQLEGAGFVVRRPFPGMDLSLADPFLLLDHMGAVEYGPGEAKGAPWHPHRGFETVTYMLDGAFEHKDSTGGGGLLTDGTTQWMTAGAGILHSELPPQEFVAKGGLFHGVQLWVNLPKALKWTPPRYQDIDAGDVRLISSADGGALIRLIAGSLGRLRRSRRDVHADHVPARDHRARCHLDLPWPADFNALAYVLSGRGHVGPLGQPLEEGQLACSVLATP